MFADGFGLCPPGRWLPQQRRSSVDMPALGFAEALAEKAGCSPSRHAAGDRSDT